MDNSKISVTINNFTAVLTICNPEQLNALNSEVLTQLNNEIEKLRKSKEIRCLIITGSGKAFVAGADISQMSLMNSAEAAAFGDLGAGVFRKIETLPFPVIAAVNGFALGGGCELAMSCDFIYASDRAKFGQPETGLGITPGFSGTQRLPRRVGIGMAKELIYTGKIIDANEALQIGLVNKVFSPEELMNESLKCAELIASKAPIAVKNSKEAMNLSTDCDLDAGIEAEIELFANCFDSEDQKSGMHSFLKKEKPEFKNR